MKLSNLDKPLPHGTGFTDQEKQTKIYMWRRSSKELCRTSILLGWIRLSADGGFSLDLPLEFWCITGYWWGCTFSSTTGKKSNNIRRVRSKNAHLRFDISWSRTDKTCQLLLAAYCLQQSALRLRDLRPEERKIEEKERDPVELRIFWERISGPEATVVRVTRDRCKFTHVLVSKDYGHRRKSWLKCYRLRSLNFTSILFCQLESRIPVLDILILEKSTDLGLSNTACALWSNKLYHNLVALLGDLIE